MPTSPTIAPAPTLPSSTPPPALPSIPPTPSVAPSTPVHTPTSAPTTPVTLPSTPSQSASSTRSIVTPAAGVPTEAPRPSWINVILGIAEFESAPITESEPTQERSIGDGISHLSSDGNPAARSDTASPLSPRPPAALQTFTSDDLRFTPSPETVAARLETARTLSALGQLRAGLERFLGVQNPPRAMQNAARWYPS